MIKVFEFIQDTLKKGEPVAMVVLTESGEHTPGQTSAIMAVNKSGDTYGTVGGGLVEHSLTESAVKCIETGEGKDFAYSLEKEYGMICGGSVKGYITVLNAGERLILFGGGHVSQAIAQVAQVAGMNVYIVEDRPEFEEFFQNVHYYCIDPLTAVETLNINKNDYCIIVTRGHEHDRAILEMLCEKELAYLGMIGSAKKVKRTYKEMAEDGYDKACFDSVYSPIGLDIDDGSVGEIAISVISEVLYVKNNKETLEHRKARLKRIKLDD